MIKTVTLTRTGYEDINVQITERAYDMIKAQPATAAIGLDMYHKAYRALIITKNYGSKTAQHNHSKGAFLALTDLLAIHFGQSNIFWQIEVGLIWENCYGVA